MVVLGAGVAGTNAVAMAFGLHADVTVLDMSLRRLREVDKHYHGQVKALASRQGDRADGARRRSGHRRGAGAGREGAELVSDDLVSRMQPGSVLVDIAIDQGGCFEDSRPTTHADPTYLVHGSLFYCVANMPGAVPRTSTFALTNATLPYVVELANQGWRDALRADPALALGLHTHEGPTCQPVADAHGLPSMPLTEALS